LKPHSELDWEFITV